MENSKGLVTQSSDPMLVSFSLGDYLLQPMVETIEMPEPSFADIKELYSSKPIRFNDTKFLD